MNTMSTPDNATPFQATGYAAGICQTVPYYDVFHSEIISLVKAVLPNATYWLDTGCGDGTLVQHASSCFPNTRFILADPAESMLATAKSRLSTIQKERLIFLQPAGTESLPLSTDMPLEVITAVMCHHYFNESQRRTATTKCFELLENGGIYITFENIRPETKYGTEVGLRRWLQFQIDQGKEPEAARNHVNRFDISYFPITAREHLSLLRDCGFRTAELLWLSNMQGGFYAVK